MHVTDLKRATIVGAGTMGHSAAHLFAQSGIEIDLVDTCEETLTRALHLAQMNLETLASCDRIDAKEIPDILSRIHPTTDLEAVAGKADYVLEAIVESPAAKKTLFAQLSNLCSEEIVLASNTSGLNLFEIVEVKRPERLVVHHWFAPPHIIPLVEVVPGENTSQETLRFSQDLLNFLGKKPVLLNSFAPHFIVNRIQISILTAIYQMIEENFATVEDIDLALKSSLGMRMPIVGAIQSQDFTGLDTVLAIQKALGINAQFPTVEKLVQKGCLGVKSSKGFYDYQERSEAEILQKRDTKLLKVLALLEEIAAFEAI